MKKFNSRWSSYLVCVMLLGLIAPTTRAQTTLPDASQGIVRPHKMVVLTAPVDGLIEAISVDEGDHVQAGQVIAQMDDALQQLATRAAEQIAASDAGIRRAKFALDEQDILLEQGEKLLARDAASDWEVRRTRVQRDQARAELDLAKVQADQDKIGYELEKQRLHELSVRAPFAGVVVEVATEQGASVKQGQDMIAVAVLDTLEAEIHLPATYYGRLTQGGTYPLQAAAPVNDTLQAKLTYVSPLIDAASQTFRCIFTVPNPELELPAGFLFTFDLKSTAVD